MKPESANANQTIGVSGTSGRASLPAGKGPPSVSFADFTGVLLALYPLSTCFVCSRGPIARGTSLSLFSSGSVTVETRMLVDGATGGRLLSMDGGKGEAVSRAPRKCEILA